jgi:predicted ATPase/DNA-binding SARP family transcriptional activator
MVVVGVLGPLVLHDADGAAVPVGSGRQRRLLAALALHAGLDVDRDVLAELVWGDDQPADPVAALHTNVARLRRVLPTGAWIATGSRGYRLDMAGDAVDSARFRAHLDAAGRAEDPARRLGELDAALRLWRGRPFDELEHPAVEPEVARLSGLHAGASEDRAAALLGLGRATEAATAAGALVAADPLRERAVAVLIRALVAAGRPAEALRAFARLRTELAGQLGTDPSAELMTLHRQVLRQELRPTPTRPGPAVPISSFVGRDADLDRVRRELADRRVLTLCGPGGVGKTRLARHAAAAVVDRYADGVLVVELAGAGPDAVEATVAAALRLSDAGPGSLRHRIVEVLAVRQQLLVVDDCEHVLDAVAGLVEAIVLGAPRVDVLATSREALRVDGEQVLPVAPLAGDAAVALLTDRIRAAAPDAVTDAETPMLARICAGLDRLPLALELAAARVPAVGLAGLLDTLDDPLDALGRGRRTAAPRHRSLRDVVEWSFGLLDEPARELFVRLGVFAGPVEVAAVSSVCGSARAVPDLVDRSLVLRHDTDPVTYGMLDTLRAFGRARLATDPGAAALRARHAAWAVALASDTGAARARPDEAAAVRRFDAHRADIERAHAWLCAHGPLEDLLRLALVCAELGYQRVRADLVRLVDEALAAVGCDPDTRELAGGPAAHPLLPRLLGLSAMPVWQRGDLDGAARRARWALTLAGRVGDPAAGRDAHEVLANVAMFGGDLDTALAHTDQAVALARAAGDSTTELMALVDGTLAAAYGGHQERSAGYEKEASRLAERLGSPIARGWAAYGAGERRAEAGDSGATALLEEAVELAEQVDAVFLAGVARHTLLTTAARVDEPAHALSRFGPLLDTWHGMGAWHQLWVAVRALAEALSRRGRHADAAVLLGALRASPRARAEFGADSARVQAVEAAARAALGPRFDAAQAEGAALGDSGAIALARRLTR